MIEVQIHPTGDRAEAETPDAAVFAAVTMIDDARTAGDTSTFTATFYGPSGKVARANVPEAVLRSADRRGITGVAS